MPPVASRSSITSTRHQPEPARSPGDPFHIPGCTPPTPQHRATCRVANRHKTKAHLHRRVCPNRRPQSHDQFGFQGPTAAATSRTGPENGGRISGVRSRNRMPGLGKSGISRTSGRSWASRPAAEVSELMTEKMTASGPAGIIAVLPPAFVASPLTRPDRHPAGDGRLDLLLLAIEALDLHGEAMVWSCQQ